MSKSLVISFISPLLLLVILVFASSKGAHFISSWPLMLIELTGLMGSNVEGFYNQWYDASIVASLTVQMVVIYCILRNLKTT